MARKALKTIAISGLTGTMAVLGGTVGAGQNVDSDEIAALGDTEYTTVPRQAKHNKDVVITFLNESGAVSTEDIGAVKSITLTYTMTDGKTDATASTVTGDFVILDVNPGTVEVDGERKATVEVTLRKHGPSAGGSSAT
jgi:hypothetical protein